MAARLYGVCEECNKPLTRSNRWRLHKCTDHWCHRACWDTMVRTNTELMCPACHAIGESIVNEDTRRIVSYSLPPQPGELDPMRSLFEWDCTTITLLVAFLIGCPLFVKFCMDRGITF